MSMHKNSKNNWFWTKKKTLVAVKASKPNIIPPAQTQKKNNK